MACRHGDNPVPDAYTAIPRPSGFPEPVYKPSGNTFSEAGFKVGRKLFYDTRLSINNTISCASCHKQEFAFADAGQILSAGIEGRKANRNSPAIFNMAWNKSFMWDGGVNHIEVMPLAPLTNHAEMGETIAGIVQKLNADAEYSQMFKAAFGGDTVDDRQMFWALAQYMSQIVSANSRYDRYMAGKEQLTPQELHGLQLFRDNCAACHKEPLFTDYSFRNMGLYLQYPDSGRYRVSQKPEDIGSFKVPTLRNVALTYPYMHDGSIATLEGVLLHYAEGVQAHPALDAELKKHGKPGIPLSAQERADIILFLHTLTDSSLLHDANL